MLAFDTSCGDFDPLLFRLDVVFHQGKLLYARLLGDPSEEGLQGIAPSLGLYLSLLHFNFGSFSVLLKSFEIEEVLHGLRCSQAESALDNLGTAVVFNHVHCLRLLDDIYVFASRLALFIRLFVRVRD